MAPTNPFPALLLRLNSTLYLNPTPSYHVQLYALSGAMGLCLLLTLISLTLQIRRRSFWIVRLHTTASGTWMVPNAIVCWLLGSCVFLAFSQVYIHYGIEYARVGSDYSNSMIWRVVIWLPLYIGGVNLTWATFLAPLLARSPSDTNPFDLARHPRLVSGLFLFIQAAATGLIVTASVITNGRFNTAFTLGRDLAAILEEASQAVDNGELGVIGGFYVQLEELTPKVEASFESMINAWRITWTIYGGFNVILDTIYIFAALAHYRSLRKSIQKLESSQTTTDLSSYSRQMKRLVWSHRALWFTTLFTVILSLSFFGCSVYIAIDGRKVVAGHAITQTMLLIPLYIFSVCGNVSTFVLVLRGLLTATPSARSPGTPLSSRPSEVFTISPEDEISGSTHTNSFQLVISKRGPVGWSGEKCGLGPIAH